MRPVAAAGDRASADRLNLTAGDQVQWQYGERDPATLAAAYAYGLARNRSCSDGNNRIAFVAMAVFRELNGRELNASEEAIVQLVLSLAAGALDEADLVAWIRAHISASF